MMRIYKTIQGIVLEKENKFYRIEENNWDHFINDDNLYQKIAGLVQSSPPSGRELISSRKICLLNDYGTTQKKNSCTPLAVKAV